MAHIFVIGAIIAVVAMAIIWITYQTDRYPYDKKSRSYGGGGGIFDLGDWDGGSSSDGGSNSGSGDGGGGD